MHNGRGSRGGGWAGEEGLPRGPRGRSLHQDVRAERNHRRTGRHKHPCDLECSWGRSRGEGLRLVQHYSQVDSATVEKPSKIKVHRNVTSAPPGEEESSEDSSQELCREKQPVLFIWMSVRWWVQTIFSALWDQNQNRIKQTKIPPKSPRSSKKECKKSYGTY